MIMALNQILLLTYLKLTQKNSSQVASSLETEWVHTGFGAS